MKKPLQVITNKSEPVSIKRRTDLILFFVLVIDISNNTTKTIETQKNISFRKISLFENHSDCVLTLMQCHLRVLRESTKKVNQL